MYRGERRTQSWGPWPPCGGHRRPQEMHGRIRWTRAYKPAARGCSATPTRGGRPQLWPLFSTFTGPRDTPQRHRSLRDKVWSLMRQNFSNLYRWIFNYKKHFIVHVIPVCWRRGTTIWAFVVPRDMRTRIIEDDGTLSSNHTGQQKAYLTYKSVIETCIALIFTSRYQGRDTFSRLGDTAWRPWTC